MNSVQELIREKLAAALEEEKRRIAAKLLGEAVMPPKKSDPAIVAQKKQKKAAQIQVLRQRISDLQSKAPKAKDPKAMNDRLTLLKKKLSVLSQEMAQIK